MTETRFCQECYICPSVLYFLEVEQIQHGTIKYGNKSTFQTLISPTQSTVNAINVLYVFNSCYIVIPAVGSAALPCQRFVNKSL